MSDYLGRLLQRSTAASPAIVPRVSTRFEPWPEPSLINGSNPAPGPTALMIGRATTQATPIAEPPSVYRGPRFADAPQPPPRTQPADAAQPSSAERRWRIEARPQSPGEMVLPASAPISAQPPRDLEHVRASPLRISEVPGAGETVMKRDPLQVPQSVSPQSVSPSRQPRRIEVQDVDVNRVAANTVRMPQPLQPRIQAEPPAGRLESRSAVQVVRGMDAGHAAAPAIHVRIGRIDVRASTPAAQHQVQIVSPPTPELTLAEYLRQRRKGER